MGFEILPAIFVFGVLLIVAFVRFSILVAGEPQDSENTAKASRFLLGSTSALVFMLLVGLIDDSYFSGHVLYGLIGFFIPYILIGVFKLFKSNRKLIYNSDRKLRNSFFKVVLITFLVIIAITQIYLSIPEQTTYQKGLDKIIYGRIKVPEGEEKCYVGFNNATEYEDEGLVAALKNPGIPQEAYDKVVSLIEKGDQPRLFLYLLRNGKTQAKEVLELNYIYKQKYTNNCSKEILEAIITHPYTPFETVEDYLLNDDRYIQNHSSLLRLLWVTDNLVSDDFMYTMNWDVDFFNAHKLNLENTCAKIKLAHEGISYFNLEKGYNVYYDKERYDKAKNGPCKEFWKAKKT